MTEALIGFIAIFALALLRVPLAFGMGLVGIVGIGLTRSWGAALASTAQVVQETGFAYTLSVIPLFILMGNFVARAGLAHELFHAAYVFIGHLRGGLAHATIAACAGFGAICGSSIATAATMSKVAYPSMKKLGYSDSLSTGVIAAGGTLGIMIPPSTIMVIYGIVTETNIGKLFAAGVIPRPADGRAADGRCGDHDLARPGARPGRREIQLGGALEGLARHLGGAVAGDRRSGRHLWRHLHRDRGRWHRCRRRLPVRRRAPGSHGALHPGRADRVRAHHGHAVHAADCGDDLRQLCQLHEHALATSRNGSPTSACRR
jgi:hypothetical protein